jgi:hypothetical protein
VLVLEKMGGKSRASSKPARSKSPSPVPSKTSNTEKEKKSQSDSDSSASSDSDSSDSKKSKSKQQNDTDSENEVHRDPRAVSQLAKPGKEKPVCCWFKCDSKKTSPLKNLGRAGSERWACYPCGRGFAMAKNKGLSPAVGRGTRLSSKQEVELQALTYVQHWVKSSY